MGLTPNNTNLNLNFVLRFERAGSGQIKYLLKVPEFRKRLSEAIIRHGYITEEIFLEILKQMYADAMSGMFERGVIPVKKLSNMINRLERPVQVHEQISEVFESKEVLP